MTHSTLHRPAVFPTKRSWMLALVSLAATRCCTAFTALPFRRTSSFRPDQSWATTAFRPPRCFSSRRNSSDTKDSLVSSSSSEAESVVLSNNNTTTTTRQEALHSQLAQIGIDPGQLQQAAVQSIQNPIQGYDGRYGKSAIKTYRSFIRPKTHKQPSGDLIATAFRTAQQISFLQKRHESHQTEWIRHQDDPAASSSQNNPSKTTRRRTFPIILLLDNVRSALNVGSLFRTADAAGCAQVWTVGITPHPNGNGAEKLQKSALGAETIVSHRHFSSVQEAIDSIRSSPDLDSYKIIGMETTHKSVDYTKVDYSSYYYYDDDERSSRRRGIVLVLGNEVTGVPPSVLDQLDVIVEIPTFGVKNSLNVAACAPIVVYEILRQWNHTHGSTRG